jgi:hypothetical protein
LVKLLGKQVSPERIKALIEQADFDGDKRISFSDFLQLFRLDNSACTVEAMGIKKSDAEKISSTSTSESSNNMSLQKLSTPGSEA